MSAKLLRQFAKLDRAAVNAEARTVEIAFSSEYPVDRGNYSEILDHAAGSCDLTRLSDGGPLLLCHESDDGEKQIGVIESARIDADKMGRAVVRFGKGELAEEIFRDVQDGIRRCVSVGYARTSVVASTKEQDGREVIRYRWTPYELSIVPIPADPNSGVGRGAIVHREFATLDTKFMTDTVATIDPGKVLEIQTSARASALADEQKRCVEITDAADKLCELHPHGTAAIRGIARAGVVAKKPAMEVSNEMLTAIPGLRVADKTVTIGMNGGEVKRFSLLRAINQILATGRLEGLEKEVSDTASKLYRIKGQRDGSIILPEEIVQRDMTTSHGLSRAEFIGYANTFRAQNVTTATAGGYTVATVLGPMIEYLRNDTVLGRAGVTLMGGLTGDVSFPVQSGGATAYWVTETGAVTDSQATFGQKTVTPHRLGATLPFTTQFLAQSSISAEAFLNAELMTVLGLELDRAGLAGSGAAGEPLGVAATTGINATVTYSNAAVWADIIEHETGITTDNAAIGEMAFIINSATVGKWKQALVASASGSDFIISSNTSLVNGYPYHRTNQTLYVASQSLFGVWKQLLSCSWAGREVIVDPYALKKSGQIEITMNQFHDYLVRQPLAFNCSTDSAAQ